jgi:DNA invertase Pin-like site-specific DNA recombinase
MLIGYMRVSKTDEPKNLDFQKDALLEYGTNSSSLYSDHANGKRDDPPGLTANLKALRYGDTLIV